jgi:hypothetical protein
MKFTLVVGERYNLLSTLVLTINSKQYTYLAGIEIVFEGCYQIRKEYHYLFSVFENEDLPRFLLLDREILDFVSSKS